ncbi:Isochorismatase-like protein [Mycena filopes]|nr:Isochorismatase-like protein [Mycena filopes]
MSSSNLLTPALPHTALVVIDVQQSFLDPRYRGRRSTPNLEANITSLLTAFRAHNLPILHVHHINTKNPDSLYYEKTRPNNVRPQDFVKPAAGEAVLRKYDKSSGFGAVLVSGEPLEDVLRAQGINTVILVGISSAHCVSSTARSAGDRGFGVVVVADGTATHAVEAVDFGDGAMKGDGEGGKEWTAETLHAVAMANLNRELADVVQTAEVLKFV